MGPGPEERDGKEVREAKKWVCNVGWVGEWWDRMAVTVWMDERAVEKGEGEATGKASTNACH